MLTAGGSFADRQWVASGASSGASNSIAYGNGEVRIFSGASGRHCLCHFDCMKDQYPTYSATKTYNVGNIVYGGLYGHGLYQKTGSAGGAPVYTSATNAQDANGWTRYRPTPRQIAQGGVLSISLKLKLDRTGFTITSNNAIRIGLFNSVGSYINYDNHGLSNAVFNGYSGYMFGYGPADNRILKRTETANPPLLSTINGVYQQLASTSVVGFGGQNEYNVSIKLKRIGSSLEITSHIYGSGYSSKFTHIDATPFTSFDTLAFYTVSSNVASMAVSNPIATYDGGTQAIPTGIGSDNPANAAQADATASLLIDGPFYNTEGNSASGFIGGQSWRTMAVTTTINGRPSYYYGAELVSWTGSQWQYQGSRVFSTSSSNVAYPWLATAWTNNYSVAKVIPGYAKPSMYPGVP
jgi:hypothetical protein